MVLALFTGIGDASLGLTLKKPKENQCFWLRALKNLRKINVFALPGHLVDPGVTIGPTTAQVARRWAKLGMSRREGTAHRQNLYTQTPDPPHACGRLVFHHPL